MKPLADRPQLISKKILMLRARDDRDCTWVPTRCVLRKALDHRMPIAWPGARTDVKIQSDQLRDRFSVSTYAGGSNKFLLVEACTVCFTREQVMELKKTERDMLDYTSQVLFILKHRVGLNGPLVAGA
jgi:hypothetical protein